jgi:hypothetical protein
MGGRFTSNGRVSLVAHVSGDTVFTGGRLRAPGQTPLDCDRHGATAASCWTGGSPRSGPCTCRTRGSAGGCGSSARPSGTPRPWGGGRRASRAIALFADGIELGGDLDARSGVIAGRPERAAPGRVRPGPAARRQSRRNGEPVRCPAALPGPRRVVRRPADDRRGAVPGRGRGDRVRPVAGQQRIGASLDCSGRGFTEPRLRKRTAAASLRWTCSSPRSATTCCAAARSWRPGA